MKTRLPNKRSRWRQFARWMLIAAVAWLAATVVLVLVLRFVNPPTSAFMVERRLAAWRNHEANFRLQQQFVPMARIAPDLPISLIAAEDQKFPTHHGFDVQAIEAAMDEADDGGRLRGASTISQQTAKNLFLWNGRSFVRKGFEVYFTVLLELLWSKARILEVYANIAEFGDGVYGAEAAAHAFFGKSAAQLSPREAALLAGSLPNPRKLRAAQPSPYLQQRADWIERQVRQLGGPAYLPR